MIEKENADRLDRLTAAVSNWQRRYAEAGILPYIWQFQGFGGKLWTFHSCNDLGIPYFRLGKGKKLYTNCQGSQMIADIMTASLVK